MSDWRKSIFWGEPKFIGHLDPDNRVKIYRMEHHHWKARQAVSHLRTIPGSMYYLNNEPSPIGRWHYWYENDKGQRISLVLAEHGFPGGRRVRGRVGVRGGLGLMYHYFYWEISSEGTLKNCRDAEELFNTKKEAEKRILELLLGPENTLERWGP